MKIIEGIIHCYPITLYSKVGNKFVINNWNEFVQVCRDNGSLRQTLNYWDKESQFDTILEYYYDEDEVKPVIKQPVNDDIGAMALKAINKRKQK